jgi:hypothetical protein
MSAHVGEDADSRLSRSGASSLAGKLSRRLDIPVSEELEDAVIALATLEGVPKAEYVRRVLERSLFGDLSMLRRMARTGAPGQCEDHRSFIG